MRFSKHTKTKSQHFVYPVVKCRDFRNARERMVAEERYLLRGTPCTSSVGQAALTPRTRGRSEKRGGNGRGRALSTSSNATFRWSGCFNTSSRFNTLYTWPFREESSRTFQPGQSDGRLAYQEDFASSHLYLRWRVPKHSR